MENQVGHFRIGQGHVIRQQAAAQCLVADIVEIQTLAIVREMNHHFITFLTDLDPQFAGFILACSLAFFA
ncbi:hypothetical protein D3C81_1635790 [compost metagenome]